MDATALREMQAPMRTSPVTAGKVVGSIRRTRSINPPARLSGDISETAEERSRMTPFPSRIPGRSVPLGP